MSSENHTLDPDGDVFLILTDQDEVRKPKRSRKSVERKKSKRKMRVQCSSKHLTLASPVFNAMLSRNFKESAALRSVGTLELPLPDDDPAALLILLYLMHWQTNAVPLDLQLDMLTRIAIMVDKYQLQMVVVIISGIWIDRLKDNIPQTWTEDLRRWLFISHVFQRPTEFKFATEIAEQQCGSRIDESEEIALLIPSSIVGQLYFRCCIFINADRLADSIDQNRQGALLKIITALHSALETYTGSQLVCSKTCDAVVLGSLTKAMKLLQATIPMEAPYHKLSFDGLAQDVKDMEIFADKPCKQRIPRGSCPNSLYRGSNNYRNTVKEDVERVIEEAKQGLCGLNLNQFS